MRRKRETDRLSERGVDRRMQMARTASLGFGALAGFQLALAAGAPWGELAWGGAGGSGVLPARLRLASALSAAVWVGAGRVVLVRAAGRGYERTTVCLAALLMLGSAMNAVSPSRAEARLWTPVSLVLAALTAAIAHGQPTRRRRWG